MIKYNATFELLEKYGVESMERKAANKKKETVINLLASFIDML
jgi:hypothetical protein